MMRYLAFPVFALEKQGRGGEARRRRWKKRERSEEEKEGMNDPNQRLSVLGEKERRMK